MDDVSKKAIFRAFLGLTRGTDNRPRVSNMSPMTPSFGIGIHMYTRFYKYRGVDFLCVLVHTLQTYGKDVQGAVRIDPDPQEILVMRDAERGKGFVLVQAEEAD